MTTVRKTKTTAATGVTRKRATSGFSGDGYFVLENNRGETVRFFHLLNDKVFVVYRRDTHRVEVVSTLQNLIDEKADYTVVAETTQAQIKKSPVALGQAGQLTYVENVEAISANYELAPEQTLEAKRAFGWSAVIQLTMLGVLMIAGALTGGNKSEEVTVTLIDQKVVEQMMQEPPPEVKQPENKPAKEAAVPQPKQAPKDVVVAPSLKKINKNDPIPTRSTSFKKNARVNGKGPRGGGHKGPGPRGYGTNEANMNSIGALGALNEPRVRGGNGGRGGLNLQAVGTEAGSGAGGKGFGGFGNNGAGGRGKGGLGKGKGMGFSNAMYGKGLIAAPFGDGGAAPGSGGYGTRGKAGGGAQGAGYGTETIVGSWKGTGPKGDGPAGSGSGSGLDYGSPWGSAEGDGGDAVITGGLELEQIEAVINRNIGQIRYCYEQGLQKKPTLSGRVTMRWKITGSGSVSTTSVAHSSVRSAQVENCIASKVRTWKFPKPHGGVNVAVTYPFSLRRNL